MNKEALKKNAIMLLSAFRPADKDDPEAFFLSTLKMPEFVDGAPISKIFKVAKFKMCFKKIEGKTYRGAYARNNFAGINHVTDLDFSDIEKTNFEIPKIEQNNKNIHFTTSEDVLKYISDNWYDLRQYMTEDIKREHARDPSFKNMSPFKKRRAGELAGFKRTFTLFEENRSIPAPEIKKSQKKKTVRDMAKLLYGDMFEQPTTMPT